MASSHRSVLGPFFILLYVNDQPKIKTDTSQPLPFADGTSLSQNLAYRVHK
jgi:hypothetical protein